MLALLTYSISDNIVYQRINSFSKPKKTEHMKKLAFLCSFVCAFGISFAQSAWDGTTVTAPSLSGLNYTVKNGAELAWIAQECNAGNTFEGKTFNISADIDLGGKEWTPIGTETNPFSGKVVGNKHHVRNFKISGSKDYAGLFGYVTGSSGANLLYISNIRVANATVTGGNYVGGLVGCIRHGVLQQCSVDSSVISGNTAIGGMVGSMRNAASAESYVKSMKVTAASLGGLFIGLNDTAELSTIAINDCYAKGILTCTENGGGFVGRNAYKTTIRNCYCIIQFSGKGSKLGLFCGRNDTLAILENCAYNNNLNGGLATAAIYEDHNNIDVETDVMGYTKDAFKSQNFYGNFVNRMNGNVDKWHFDFTPWSINDGHPILAWQYTLYTGVANTPAVELSVYPNPVSSTLYIKTENQVQSVEVIDLLGKSIHQDNMESIDMSQMKAGIYLIRIQTDKGTITRKVVKK